MMNLYLHYILILLTAALYGSIIGYERTSKSKAAGIKTHMIVAVSSALIVIIARYGFDENSSSRIVGQIVSGVGFLGAGVIFVKDKITVSGLTTAAGIWGTAGVGMSVGCEMYVLGFIATFILVMTNVFFADTKNSAKEYKIIIFEINFNLEEKNRFNTDKFLEENNFELISNNVYIKGDCKQMILKVKCIVDNLDINRINRKLEKYNFVINYNYNIVTS